MRLGRLLTRISALLSGRRCGSCGGRIRRVEGWDKHECADCGLAWGYDD